MKTVAIVTLILLAGCVSTPEEAATDRFESCMDRTLSSIGPFTFGSQEARIKAAQICKDVMDESP